MISKEEDPLKDFSEQRFHQQTNKGELFTK